MKTPIMLPLFERLFVRVQATLSVGSPGSRRAQSELADAFVSQSIGDLDMEVALADFMHAFKLSM